ncbi:MAG: YjbQ family protein [Chloroflexi bacterium]|nr:YjbQ family protein [Chloroflexota bacterium]
MAVVTRTLTVEAQGEGEIIDLTDSIAKELDSCPVRQGTVTIFVKHTTAAVTVIEAEPGLLSDYKLFWERMAPREVPYEHHRVEREDNGHAHVRASTLGPSLVVPLLDGCLTLGTWQRVVLMDFDTRARRREVVLQVMGEQQPPSVARA